MAQAGLRRRPAAYDDLRAVPDHLVAEIVGGELYTSPRPAPRHAMSTWANAGVVRAAPFEAVDLDLTLLWEID